MLRMELLGYTRQLYNTSYKMVMFLEGKKQSTHLSCIKGAVTRVVCEKEHVYEVDKDTGSYSGLVRSVGNPLKDNHEDQVSK